MHQINQQLLDDGWSKYKSPFNKQGQEYYAKSFDGHAKCKCNKHKRKQVKIIHYAAGRYGYVPCPDMWAVEINGQLPDNEWLRLCVEGLSDIETIYRTAGQLLEVWNYAVSIAPTIEEST